MHETILCEIVGKGFVARETAKEIADLGLMPTNQLAECDSVLPCDHPRNEYVILDGSDIVLQSTTLPSVAEAM
jgi:hypothetical protein